MNATEDRYGWQACPFSFENSPPFEFEAELLKKINCPFEILDDNSYVVHPFQRHVWNLQEVV